MNNKVVKTYKLQRLRRRASPSVTFSVILECVRRIRTLPPRWPRNRATRYASMDPAGTGNCRRVTASHNTTCDHTIIYQKRAHESCSVYRPGLLLARQAWFSMSTWSHTPFAKFMRAECDCNHLSIVWQANMSLWLS